LFALDQQFIRIPTCQLQGKEKAAEGFLAIASNAFRLLLFAVCRVAGQCRHGWGYCDCRQCKAQVLHGNAKNIINKKYLWIIQTLTVY
jgi:hypothetical protein